MPVSKKKPTTSTSEGSTRQPSSPTLPEQDEFRQHLRHLAVSAVQVLIEQVMREELEQCIGASWREVTPERRGYRNGSYTRDLVTSTGRIEDLKVPRDREGVFHSQVFERYSRYEPEVAEALTQMFVSGTSTHKVGEVAATLMGVGPVLSELKQLSWQSVHSSVMLILRKENEHEEHGLMDCPHCAATTTTKRAKKTKLGYATFFCSHCQCTFNERTGTPFNYLEFPTDIVLLVVVWRLRYKLSLRDLAELFLERGFVFTHEAVRDWEERFAPVIAEQLRSKRRGQAGRSWYVDETYVRVNGKWCYLYRAIDRDGNLVDSRLSEKRDMDAAKQFFEQAMMVVGHTPHQVTTDGHASYPRAVRETLGDQVQHQTNKYLNNRLEQDHRGIKQRYYPMRGFGAFLSAARFCRAFDELRQYFRSSHTAEETVSLVHQRQFFRERLAALQELMRVVSSIN